MAVAVAVPTAQDTGTVILITGPAIALLFFEYEVALPGGCSLGSALQDTTFVLK